MSSTVNDSYGVGSHLVVVGNLGIPSLVRVEADGTWRCVAGIFRGREVRAEGKRVVHVCQDGDVFEDLGLVVRGGVLLSAILDDPGSVKSKRENWQRASAGWYGNRLRSWDTLKDLRASGWDGLVTVRSLLGGGGPCVYDVGAEEVGDVLMDLMELMGRPESDFCFNEGASDGRVLYQGEYLNDVVEVDGRVYMGAFHFSTVQRKMRNALRESARTVYGLAALLALRSGLTPSSAADLEALIDAYPYHVFEVSVYSGTLGDLPGRNAIVWEIRQY